MTSAPAMESPEDDHPEDPTGLPSRREIQRLLRGGIGSFQAGEEGLALARFKKAYLLSSQHGEPHTQETCLFNLGATYIATGKARKGLKCLKMAQRRDASLYFNMAAAYDNMGKFARAVEFYQKAIHGYGADERQSVGDATVKLAYCLVNLGERTAAANAFLSAGQTYQRLQLPEEAAMAMREAANYFLQSQEATQEDVVETLHACGQLCARITNRKLKGKLYNDVGLHFAQLGLFWKAEHSFRQALQLCRQDDASMRERAVLLQNLGATYNALEQPERALRFHSEAADVYGALGGGQRTAQAQCLYNLATAHAQLGNYPSAEFYYRQARGAFAEAGDSSGEALTWEALAETHRSWGHLDQALQSYEQALELSEKGKEALAGSHQEHMREKLSALTHSLAHHRHRHGPISPAEGLVG